MNADLLDQLPDEVAALLQQHEQEKIVKREQFSQYVSKKRDEAVAGRASSGVEEMWAEDEEHYFGIDAANRGRSQYKPLAPTAGFSPRVGASKSTRSTLFLNITRPYVDAIVARTCDILLPTDDKNWGIEPTPNPDLIAKRGSTEPVAPMNPMASAVQGAMPRPATVGDLVEQALAEARTAAERAERQLDDWLTECNYNDENRKAIFDSARIGTGILKGPFPDKVTASAVTQGPDGYAIKMQVKINPRSKRIDPWNFYPDPACGENIHEGGYVCERDYITARKLRELKGVPGYLNDAIDNVLEQGPTRGKSSDGASSPNNKAKDQDTYEIWYMYISAGVEELEAAGVDVEGIESDQIDAIVTLVNSEVIKAAVNPLAKGRFPYDVMAWQRVAGQWTGIGVSRQIRAPQQAINAAHRNMLDNAGLSGGPILIVRQNMIVPADGNWELKPRKIFYTTPDADVRSVQDAIYAVNIPNMQAELMNIIQFELKTAELVTGFPLLMQGQANPQSTPDTYGGQILATNNASTVLRFVARNYDANITIPHINRYYEYNLEYGDDESTKGDFQIVARGSSVLVEREIQAQEMVQLIQMSGNPAFGLDPKKLIAEYFKSRRFDPRKFQYSEEELKAMAQQPNQPAVPVQVAQIRAQAQLETAKIKEQGAIAAIQVEQQLEVEAQQQGRLSPQAAAAQAKIAEAQIRAASEERREQSRANTELAYVQSEAQIAEQNAQARMQELQMKRDIALLEYANKRQLSLDQVKAGLAKAAMDNETKRQVASAELQAKQLDAHLDRQHDGAKHVMNVQANQQISALTQAHQDAQQDKEHQHELEVAQMNLEAAKEKMQEVPGKKQ